MFLCDCKCTFDSKIRNSNQKPKEDKCQWECKIPLKPHLYWQSCTWNLRICTCECHEISEFHEYLNNCTKNVADNLVNKCIDMKLHNTIAVNANSMSKNLYHLFFFCCYYQSLLLLLLLLILLLLPLLLLI